MGISTRKSEHIDIALNQDVDFKTKTSGFEKFTLVHCALPEFDFESVSTEIEFLGKPLTFPLMISAMTGGCSKSLEINRILAEASAITGIALGVGSQRQLLESDEHIESYQIVRKVSPGSVIIGNIGAEEVALMRDPAPILRMIDIIEADGMAVHLNPLQEVLQPEGQARFSGVLQGIERLVQELPVPVIVKEVGCGISQTVAKKLLDVGVYIIDVAGAGGTSWAGIEYYRTEQTNLAKRFWDWGIPTAESLEMVTSVKGIQTIASGGIDGGITMAKAIALGARLCGVARPILMALHQHKLEGVIELIKNWQDEFCMAMFLTGCQSVESLREEGVIRKWDSTNDSRISSSV